MVTMKTLRNFIFVILKGITLKLGHFINFKVLFPTLSMKFCFLLYTIIYNCELCVIMFRISNAVEPLNNSGYQYFRYLIKIDFSQYLLINQVIPENQLSK